MKLKVAINGFGRIGRQVFRVNLEKDYFDIVAINDLTDAKTLAHLLKYDSNYGTIKNEISSTSSAQRESAASEESGSASSERSELTKKDSLIVDGKSYKVLKERDPEKLPWKDLGVDLVIESTGFFTEKAGASKHLTAGAKKVIISAPGKDADFTVALGVNEEKYDPANHHVISNGSCTTNCLASLAKVLNDNFEIEKGLMTTIHSYTNDQRILDLPHEDLRRARAAGLSMIPTTTGAAKAIGLVLPELNGKLNGIAIRVPTPTVSIVDLTCTVKKETNKKEINQKLKEAAEGKMKGYLGYNELPLVSMDYKHSPLSSIIDGLSTEVIGGNLVKVLSWYDNEWGYSCRVVDLVKMVGEKM